MLLNCGQKATNPLVRLTLPNRFALVGRSHFDPTHEVAGNIAEVPLPIRTLKCRHRTKVFTTGIVVLDDPGVDLGTECHIGIARRHRLHPVAFHLQHGNQIRLTLIRVLYPVGTIGRHYKGGHDDGEGTGNEEFKDGGATLMSSIHRRAHRRFSLRVLAASCFPSWQLQGNPSPFQFLQVVFENLLDIVLHGYSVERGCHLELVCNLPGEPSDQEVLGLNFLARHAGSVAEGSIDIK